MQRSTLFLGIMALVIGLGLFKVKYQVMSQEKRSKTISKSIEETREAIHLLKAELSYLNNPARIEKLAIQHLKYHPIKAKQIIEFSELVRLVDNAKTLDVNATQTTSVPKEPLTNSKKSAKSIPQNQNKIDPLEDLLSKVSFQQNHTELAKGLV